MSTALDGLRLIDEGVASKYASQIKSLQALFTWDEASCLRELQRFGFDANVTAQFHLDRSFLCFHSECFC